MQFGLRVALLRAGPLFHDLLASRLGQGTSLCSGVGLVAGGIPKVADQHGAVPHGEGEVTQKPLRWPGERKVMPGSSNVAATAAPRSATIPAGTRAALQITTLRNMGNIWPNLLYES